MFPIKLKWIDGIYDKIESVRTQVDEFVSKEEESQYVKGLKTVGNNVKQFCSTMDPLKFAEDQLTNVGTKIEELCSSVECSVDSLLSAVNNIFPEIDPESTACKKSDLNDSKFDNAVSKAESVTSVEKTEVVASAEKSQNPKLDIEDNSTQTDQCFDEGSSPIYDELSIDKGPNAGFCSTGQTSEDELKGSIRSLTDETNADEKIIQIPRKVQLDESCVVINKNDWFVSEASIDMRPPRIKMPSTSTLKLQLIQGCQKIKTKSKSSTSENPSINKEQALPLSMSSSNNETWESEWEII